MCIYVYRIEEKREVIGRVCLVQKKSTHSARVPKDVIGNPGRNG